jgi:hypothetical protein
MDTQLNGGDRITESDEFSENDLYEMPATFER